jgi:hypothetical protein
MSLAGNNVDSFSGMKDDVMLFHLQGQLALQNEKELAGMRVKVSDLGGAGRHKLFNNAQAWGFDEVPAVAVRLLRTSPFVMFGRFCADHS